MLAHVAYSFTCPVVHDIHVRSLEVVQIEMSSLWQHLATPSSKAAQLVRVAQAIFVQLVQSSPCALSQAKHTPKLEAAHPNFCN